jgi:hypothetical protein
MTPTLFAEDPELLTKLCGDRRRFLAASGAWVGVLTADIRLRATDLETDFPMLLGVSLDALLARGVVADFEAL